MNKLLLRLSELVLIAILFLFLVGWSGKSDNALTKTIDLLEETVEVMELLSKDTDVGNNVKYKIRDLKYKVIRLKREIDYEERKNNVQE